MSFTPLARVVNFTKENLKTYLAVYPDMSLNLKRDNATDFIEQKWIGYKKSYYQVACQFGLEDRSDNNFCYQSYLTTFPDSMIENYIDFWFKTYYAPNPYVNSNDKPILIFCELADEILAQKNPLYKVDYDTFFKSKIGGKNDDILLNLLKSYGKPLEFDDSTGKRIFSISVSQAPALQNLVTKIRKGFPIPITNDEKSFFNRYTYNNYCRFYNTSNTLTGIQTNPVFERNRIVFGAPGTGKSHKLDDDKKLLLSSGGEFERVTFHPDYSYSQFIGTYKPITKNGKSIDYAFVPGPLMRVLTKAFKNIVDSTDPITKVIDSSKIKPYLLIVEEINRAKASAVFGDTFQLLDRDADGVSEYAIHPSEEIKDYLVSEIGGKKEDYDDIKLPDNLFIWSTMNSADQGVYPMDTAFKRRWSFEYIGINDKESYAVSGSFKYPGQNEGGFSKPNIEWNALRKAINDLLSSDNVKVSEDKLLGPFFINTSKYIQINSDELENDFYKLFESKVLMYLFEDAAKTKRGKVFIDSNSPIHTRFSELCKSFEELGIGIFKDIDGESFESRYASYCINS